MRCCLSQFKVKSKESDTMSVGALGAPPVPVPASYQITSANQITTVQFNPYMSKIVEQLLQIREKIRDDARLVVIMNSVQGLRELFFRVIERGPANNSDLSEMEVLLQAVTTEGIQALQRVAIRLCNKLFTKLFSWVERNFAGAVATLLKRILERVSAERFATGDICTGLIEALTQMGVEAGGDIVNQFIGAEVIDMRENSKKLFGSIISEEDQIKAVYGQVATINQTTQPVANTGGNLPPLADFSGGAGGAGGISQKDLLLYGGAGILTLSAVIIATNKK